MSSSSTTSPTGLSQIAARPSLGAGANPSDSQRLENKRMLRVERLMVIAVIAGAILTAIVCTYLLT